ncbi:MAG: hypothetical protein JXB48_03580 [Candidatus Latescibacteria bacterium]|nr:hypothetical protein [Candidatus Latescibacterota bacterium]
MKQSLTLVLTFFLVALTVHTGCGVVQVGSSGTRQNTESTVSPVLAEWLGTYTGTMTTGYANSSKTVDSPAELTISEFAGKVSFVLKRSNVSPEVRVNAEPSQFSSHSIKLSTRANQRGRSSLCEISAELDGDNLTGKMKLDPAPATTEIYTFVVSKQK